MNSKHLAEEDIQNYILDGETDEAITKHIAECAACKAQFDIYVVLNRALGNIEPEVFSFDVSEMVMHKIEAMHKVEKYLNYGFYALAIIGISLIGYFSLPAVLPFLRSIRVPNAISASMIALVAVGVLLFFVSDMIRVQKEKELKLFQ